MKYQNGLRAYAVVKFNDYPEWNILITDLEEYPNGAESVIGLAFNSKGEFETLVNLRLPMIYKEIDYLYPYKESKGKLNLNLVSDKLPITEEDILDSDLEQTDEPRFATKKTYFDNGQ